MRKLLTGNEAVAEGIIVSEVEVIYGYAGAPFINFLNKRKIFKIYVVCSIM
ncbi:MAG TPA: hypothetical protein VFD10_09380 [Atribacterota bacterium]|nr:hypothetical protein [Atribacterota bacterium]